MAGADETSASAAGGSKSGSASHTTAASSTTTDSAPTGAGEVEHKEEVQPLLDVSSRSLWWWLVVLPRPGSSLLLRKWEDGVFLPTRHARNKRWTRPRRVS